MNGHGTNERLPARVRAGVTEVTAEPGQILALPGDVGSGMFVLLDGSVSVELRVGQIELIAPDFVGELGESDRDRTRPRAVLDHRCGDDLHGRNGKGSTGLTSGLLAPHDHLAYLHLASRRLDRAAPTDCDMFSPMLGPTISPLDRLLRRVRAELRRLRREGGGNRLKAGNG